MKMRITKAVKRDWRNAEIVAFLAAIFIRFLRATWRVQVITESTFSDSQRLIFCFWHGNQAALFAYRQPRPIAVLSSLSRDGALQAKILTRLGYVVRRGSSTRGGVSGLKAMVRCIREGCDCAFAVDGPRGPYHRAKPGAIEAARQSGALIVPVSSLTNRAWVFARAWDRYTLPKPFAKVTIRLGKSISAEHADVRYLDEAIDRPLGLYDGADG